MRNKAVPLLVAGLAFLFFVICAALINALRPPQGVQSTILWGGMIALGLATSALTYAFMNGRKKAGEQGTDAAGAGRASAGKEEAIEVAFAAARTRLASFDKSRKLGRLPVVMVLGPRGSTKTTILTHSGLSPELLAGETHRGDTVVPTEPINLWFSQGVVFLEAGGSLLERPAAWMQLLRHLKPDRLAAVLGRDRQAPRMAVVCFPCEQFYQAGGARDVLESAKLLRTRLLEMSHELGIRLPVYVLFTKADRIPSFTEYVRNLSQEEAQEVLGTTLRTPEVGLDGLYAERESGRLRQSFQAMFESLARKRMDFLAREASNEVRAAAYEFPREFLKISDLATQFLLELCRPTQLGVSPFLRGFYFSGVRPIFVNDSAASAQSRPAAQVIPLGATTVFNPQAALAAAQKAPQQEIGSRKVPQWVFLKRFFQDVLLRDQTAMGVTGSGTRVQIARRVALAAAAIVCLILVGGFTTSYFGNRSLLREALAASQGLESRESGEAQVPSVEALQRLERMRVSLALLRQYEQDSPPLRLRWGLFTGDEVHPELRRLYFDRFERLVWGRSRAELFAGLAGLPPVPQETSEYGTTYDALKAYLITTTHERESTSGFLTPVLMRHWWKAEELDTQQADLARRQFDFFAAELPHGNPYASDADAQLVQRTRGYLQRFAGLEQLYQAVLSEASRGGEPVDFHKIFPNAASAVRDPYVVPAAFTARGWQQVQAQLKDVERLFTREQWVVGERFVSPQDRAQLAGQLRTRYLTDYIGHWQQFLRQASVVGYSGAAEAAARLERLADNQSPLFQALSLVSQHTNVDSVNVAPAFQPVHLISPPGVKDRYVGEAGGPYVQALLALQSSVSQVAKAQGPDRVAAVGQASSAAEQVRMGVRQLAQGFSIEGQARGTGEAVQRLLLFPVAGIDPILSGVPTATANAGGQAFCRQFRTLTANYPFNPRSATDASIDDVTAMLQPGNSALSAFYDDALQDLLVRQGNRYAPRVGATPRPSPAFVNFFNRATQASTALFADGSASPSVVFEFRPQLSDQMPEITLNIDGRAEPFTRRRPASRTFQWDGARARSARITGQINGSEVTLVDAENGPWALFRLFQKAEWQQQGGGRYLVRWPVIGQSYSLTAELTFESGAPVFREDFLGGLSCVPSIVQ